IQRVADGIVFVAQAIDQSPDRPALAVGFVQIAFEQGARAIGNRLVQRGFSRRLLRNQSLAARAQAVDLALKIGNAVLSAATEESHPDLRCCSLRFVPAEHGLDFWWRAVPQRALNGTARPAPPRASRDLARVALRGNANVSRSGADRNENLLTKQLA